MCPCIDQAALGVRGLEYVSLGVAVELDCGFKDVKVDMYSYFSLRVVPQ